MNILKKKWNELMYSLNSEDHYAEYNPRDPVAFNMGRRANNAISGSRVRLTSSTDELGDEEMGFGMEDGGEEINIDEFSSSDNSGVSEVLLAWRHIDLWTTEHNPDLNATLGDPCTQNDINNAEEDLAVVLPSAVKVSLRVHDGQEDLESLAGTSGLIYGLQLMSLDQVVEMTEKWRSVAKGIIRHAQASAAAAVAAEQQREALLKQQQQDQQNFQKQPQSLQTLQYQQKLREKNLRSSMYPNWEDSRRRQFKLPNIPEQKSVPPNCIQPVYANPGWIPLVTDHAGNHIAVDLAPAPGGKYAQIIIFGRDFDTKYVIADNWGDFLLMFANDLEAGNWYLVDDNDDFLSGDGELAFRDKKTDGPVLDYLEVLKRRAIQRARELPQSQVPSREDSQPLPQTLQQQQNNRSFFDSDSLEDSNNTVTHKDLPEFADLGKESLQETSASTTTKAEPKEEPKAEPKEEPKEDVKNTSKKTSTREVQSQEAENTQTKGQVEGSSGEGKPDNEKHKTSPETVEQKSDKKESEETSEKSEKEVENLKEEFESVAL
ncbi:hypothetical protein ZYGM_000248 [Zygosaccharomyces mellis]|uniref:Knr4/Smi1-like domain-containing protein n=1 Tax=Zygosaccharomyces mellis TaxID=42258 RepID=A0A4C2E8C9_9SACH|nr:hypothetical protein ZYGM_000248 [Zygosaccharomyces mellis]